MNADREEVNWNHDVAEVWPSAVYRHIVMRHARFSLCGQIMRDERLRFVGAWDSGQATNCPSCMAVWAAMRGKAALLDLL